MTIQNEMNFDAQLKAIEELASRGNKPVQHHRSVTGEELKLMGMDRVEENERAEWREAALCHLKALAAEQRLLNADDLRKRILGAGMLHPFSPNVYGSIMRSGMRNKWIEFTGKFEPSKIPSCHGRHVKIWRSLLH